MKARVEIRLGLVYDCMVVEHPYIHVYAYVYECRSHTTPPKRSNNVSVVLFSKLFASCLAPSSPMPFPAKHMHERLAVWMNGFSSVWEYGHLKHRQAHTRTYTQVSVSCIACVCAETGGSGSGSRLALAEGLRFRVQG